MVALLDDPRCTSCASVMGRAQGLELGADYGKVGMGSWSPTVTSPPSCLAAHEILLPLQGAVGGEGVEGTGWSAPE